MNESIEPTLREHCSRIGRIGGKSGKGDAKRRSSEHYRKAARKRWDNANTEKERTNEQGVPNAKG